MKKFIMLTQLMYRGEHPTEGTQYEEANLIVSIDNIRFIEACDHNRKNSHGVVSNIHINTSSCFVVKESPKEIYEMLEGDGPEHIHAPTYDDLVEESIGIANDGVNH